MQIDAHTHILSLAQDAEFTTEYGREGSLCIYRSLGLLRQQRGLQGLLEIAVQELRALTGFDRVMAYRFRHDASGDVVAEVADRFRQARRVLNHLADRYLLAAGQSWFSSPGS